MSEMTKPILCLDFDGVIHSYTSGWKGADVIPDPPVPGAMQFIADALADFEVHIFSSRSHQAGGKEAMQKYIEDNLYKEAGEYVEEFIIRGMLMAIKWPDEKPPAMITIDDRAITFTGTWPDTQELLKFKPWNKK